MTTTNKPMTFEEWNEPTEMKQWKVGALIQCENITYKAHLTPIIEAWKTAIFEETNDPAFCNYCPACEAGECVGHSYNPKYCCVADEQPY
tara:strand:+ start:581 stop:850 length:270 start_codon:yes stop_codon:yes gene_type:complete